MLTLKLQNTFKDCMHIVACSSLDIFSDGQDYVVKACMPDGSLEEYRVSCDVGSSTNFNVAFVENQNGTTTQVIRPRGAGNGKSK